MLEKCFLLSFVFGKQLLESGFIIVIPNRQFFMISNGLNGEIP